MRPHDLQQPVLFVEETVGCGFCYVAKVDVGRMVEVGYGAGEFQDPGAGSCRKAETFHRLFEEVFRLFVEGTVFRDEAVVHFGVGEYSFALETSALKLPRLENSCRNVCRAFFGLSRDHLARVDGVYPELDVDPVEKRPRKFGEILVSAALGAGTTVAFSPISARTRVGRCNEHEGRGIFHLGFEPRNDDLSVFHRGS